MFFKVDISLESSYFIFHKRGEYYEGCPALIANLGSVFVKSKEVKQDMINSKKVGSLNLNEQVATTWKEQAFDQFSIQVNTRLSLVSTDHLSPNTNLSLVS